jgi:hypothetical protein
MINPQVTACRHDRTVTHGRACRRARPGCCSGLRRVTAGSGGFGRDDTGMDRKELMGSVRALRGQGRTPKQIARALGLPPAVVAPLVRAIAAEDRANAPEREITGCWVNPGWSEGLTVAADTGWPDAGTADSGASGLVSVLVAREEGRGRASVCGYLVDVYCLGVKDVVGPQVMDGRAVPAFTRRFFSAYEGRPLEAPAELARHLVYGAVEYARSLGFEPAPGFKKTTGHLGPWAGPSAIGFGRDGKPFFIQGPHDNPARIINTLERSAGRDNFQFLISA